MIPLLPLPLDSRHISCLVGYLLFILIAACLTVLQRRVRPEALTGHLHAGVRDKAPVYLLINLAILFAIWCPKDWPVFVPFLALIGLFASLEINRKLPLLGRFRYALPAVSTGLFFLSTTLEPMVLIRLWLAILFLLMLLNLFARPGERLGSFCFAMSGSLFYIPFCLTAFTWIWQKDAAGFSAVFLYLVVSANDTFAQIIGQSFGYKPLAPTLSPAKTIEGFAGGLFFAMVAGLGLGQLLGWSLPGSILAGLAVGLAGSIGDLIESGWKRALRIKDFSGLLGAQGGILDRFDSLLFAAPVFLLILYLPHWST